MAKGCRRPGRVSLPWERIDTVLLDMDGTLLDRNFDDRFWLEHVPQAWAAKKSMPYQEARRELFRVYASHEGTLNWTDIDFWSHSLGLDIEKLKEDLGHLVRLHEAVPAFLEALAREGREVWLVTNAHPKTLKFKMSIVDITPSFNGIITSQDVGHPKEDVSFWAEAHPKIGFRKERTLHVDDTIAVLEAARRYGVGCLLHIGRFSSTSDPVFSDRFPSVEGFHEVMPGQGRSGS
jgi:putative hydrolase of the HAD superfamily